MKVVKSSKEMLLSSHVMQHLAQGCEWWPKYIYHFSHVTNIASIINDGLLRSRNQVKEINNKNLNDNASSDVIGGTEEKYKDYVRFYFRPLTPTQYHNEGIRAKHQITNLGAHCPIPVFLLFNPIMLDQPNVYFSYESLASHHHVQLHKGLERLSEAPFHYIYHNESTANLDGTRIRKHRQAEIIIEKQCDLRYLEKIVCRTTAEADTLKSLLNIVAMNDYSDKICVLTEGTFDTTDPKTMFYNYYLQILNVTQSRSNFIIEFNKNDYYPRNIDIKWLDRREACICYFNKEKYSLSNKSRINKLTVDMSNFLMKHDFVKVELKLDGHLIYCNEFYF